MVGARPAGAVLENWGWRSPLPQGNPIHNVVFANGIYVAVGDLGTILTSVDGAHWERRASGVSDMLRDCAYGAGTYVAVGDFGAVWTSTDLVNWTPQYAGTFYRLNGVTFAGGQFVAVGEQTTILTSPDGVTWTQRSSGDWDLFDITYGNGSYAAVGGNAGNANSSPAAVILTSTDGQFWTRRVVAYSSPVVSVAFGEGRFAAISQYAVSTGDLWVSTNVADWHSTASGILDYPRVISYGAGKWLIGSGYSDEYASGP
ncbi:MAG TPA: hypothetical protein VHH88_00215, partial [Verrucomicrobiae bacterium]|nr:hypothetical protein [Verrucomicrobiae bacterium]